MPLRKGQKINRPPRLNYDLFVSLYNDGLSHEDISEKLGCVIGTINTLVTKMRKQGLIKKREKHLSKIGENHNVSKLTERQVRKIIIRLLRGDSQSQIARHYKVDLTTIRAINNEKSWKHVSIDIEKIF